MMRKLLLRVLLSMLRWVWNESIHRGDDTLADKAEELAEEIVSELRKLS